MESWDSVLQLVESLKRVQQPRREEIKRLLGKSSELLHPLADPLLVENRLAIMLARSREEAYSDWLGWSLEQLGLSGAQRVLGIDAPRLQFQGDAKVEAKREHYVASGRSGASGRLDIRLCAQGFTIVDIEVKLGDADSADTDKHEGYAKSGNAARVLIATLGLRPYYGKFRLRAWQNICLMLRSEALGLLRRHGRNALQASWILQFVGAVEENLLKIPGSIFRAICNRDESAVLDGEASKVEYLRRWIESDDFDE